MKDNRPCIPGLLPVILFCSLMTASLVVADPKSSIRYLSSTAFFADEDVEVKLQAPVMKNCSWTLSYLSKSVVRGTARVSAKGETVIRFKFPAIQSHVVATATLTCVFDDKHHFRQPIHFFYKNPFESRQNFYRKKKIGILSDSEDKALGTLFAKYQVSYTQVDDPRSFDGSILISYKPGSYGWNQISQSMSDLSTKDVTIIVISPDLGDYYLGKLAAISRYQFSGCSKITDFNKKFDTKLWDNRSFYQTTFSSVSDGEDLTLQVCEGCKVFSFFQMQTGHATVTMTTWDLIGFAEKSPSAVYLLQLLLK